MALGARKRADSQPTPLSKGRTSTGGTDYGKNKGDQATTAQNPALSKQNAKSVIKLGTQYKLGKM